MANESTAGVFSELEGGINNLSEYELFVRRNSIEHTNPELDRILDMYTEVIKENKKTFERLADLEELILQLKFLEELKQGKNEIKFSLVRDYIYARALFFRRENKIRDIRVIAQLGLQTDTDIDNPKSELYGKLKKEYSPKKHGKTLEAYIASRKPDLRKEEMERLYSNKKFMELSKGLLINAMEKEIAESKRLLSLKSDLKLQVS